jgi:hypothetical protein
MCKWIYNVEVRNFKSQKYEMKFRSEKFEELVFRLNDNDRIRIWCRLFLKNQSQKNFVVVREPLFLRKETTTKKNEPPHVLVKSKVQGILYIIPQKSVRPSVRGGLWIAICILIA